MSDHVSSRHEGDLGGHLLPFGDTKRVGITITVAPDYAKFPGVQHTAWMLINLLSRFQGVVQRLSLSCPKNIDLCGRVVPLAERHSDLRTSLLTGSAAIGVVPIEADTQLECTIVVGPSGKMLEDVNIYAYGNGWCGGISGRPFSEEAFGSPSLLPFGPYIAACIAAGEVFKAARMWPGQFLAPKSAFYSLWNHRVTLDPQPMGPERLIVSLDGVLAGVGAVGCSLIHALWACPEVDGRLVIADNDVQGLDLTNLNRYALFGVNSLGRPKATTAAEIAYDSKICWEPKNEGIETISFQSPRLISAVDRNRSRAAIQARYPARIFSGSTSNLRSEVLRCGPPGVGACLRCFNPPEKIESDDELREQLRHAPELKLDNMAKSTGISLEEAREWVSTGRCGLVGERLLPYIRRSEGEQFFAVGFVSVMAGTMLAAELLKDHLELDVPLSSTAQRALFQFESPLARSNRASSYGRDPKCPMCNPSSIACQKWAERYSSPELA